MFNSVQIRKEMIRRKGHKIKLKTKQKEIPDDLYIKCLSCEKSINKEELSKNL